MPYTMSFEIASFFICLYCLLISLLTKPRQYIPPSGRRERMLNQHFVYLLLLVSTMLSSLCSVSGVQLTLYASRHLFFWQYLFHELYFVFHAVLSVCFALYVMDVNGATLGRSRQFFTVFMLPFLLTQALILTNPITSWVFYMDSYQLYHRGPLVIVLYLCGFVYIVLSFIFFFRYKQAVSRADTIAIASVICVSTAGIVVQGLHPDYLIELFAESLGLLGLMVLMEDRAGDTDQITGVLNLRAFVATNRRLIETEQSYSIIVIKLANINLFSRLFSGRDVDRFLCDVARWLETVAPRGSIFRFRHENFALVLYGRSSDEINGIARRIISRFEQTWKSADMAAQLEAVVSIIRVPEDVDSLEQLEKLLTVGFQKSGHGSLLLTHDELALLKRSFDVEAALRKALESKALQVWYQPIWSVESGRTIAAEALVRLIDDELGYISPEEFIPIAEKTGMIQELGRYVFEETCRFIGQNRMWEMGIEYIEVNLSIYQFMHDDLIEDLNRLRISHNVKAKRINLEITESVSSDEAPAVMDTMDQMIRAGYTFSLDDYGTGYSNLGRLISSDYKNVKIDKSILWDAEKNVSTALLLDNLIRSIRGLGMNVIQEGVETREQLERVIGSGCNLIQGFYFSRPLPEDEFFEYLKHAV